MRNFKFELIAAMVLFTAISVSAQETPQDLAGLMFKKVSSADSELRSRGFTQVSSIPTGNGNVSKWWSDGRNQCITVSVVKNRYEMILTAPAADCGRSDGGWYSGTRPPSWAVGTWYWNGANEQVVVIEPNGKVWVSQGGINREGWYRGNRINIGGEILTISRNRDGINLYNQSTGETSNYIRGGSTGTGNGNRFSRPPNWAVGNWTWTDGNQRRLEIKSNGNVVAWDGRDKYPGFYSNGIYTINNQPHSLTREGSRIRLTNQATGDTYVYRNR